MGEEGGGTGVGVDLARCGHTVRLCLVAYREANGIEVTIVAGVGLLLVDGGGVVARDERRSGAVVDADIVDVGDEVFGEIVRAFAVGHDDEAVDLHPFVAGSGEYDFLPFVGFEGGTGDLGKLYHFVALTGTVLALTESDDHGTSGFGRANPSVYVFRLGGEVKGFVERDACAEGVRPVARALHGEYFYRRVDGAAVDGVDFTVGGGVVGNVAVAGEGALTEGRLVPSVEHTEGFPSGLFEIEGGQVDVLCGGGHRQSQGSHGEDMFEFHCGWALRINRWLRS